MDVVVLLAELSLSLLLSSKAVVEAASLEVSLSLSVAVSSALMALSRISFNLGSMCLASSTRPAATRALSSSCAATRWEMGDDLEWNSDTTRGWPAFTSSTCGGRKSAPSPTRPAFDCSYTFITFAKIKNKNKFGGTFTRPLVDIRYTVGTRYSPLASSFSEGSRSHDPSQLPANRKDAWKSSPDQRTKRYSRIHTCFISTIVTVVYMHTYI